MPTTKIPKRQRINNGNHTKLHSALPVGFESSSAGEGNLTAPPEDAEAGRTNWHHRASTTSVEPRLDEKFARKRRNNYSSFHLVTRQALWMVGRRPRILTMLLITFGIIVLNKFMSFSFMFHDMIEEKDNTDHSKTKTTNHVGNTRTWISSDSLWSAVLPMSDVSQKVVTDTIVPPIHLWGSTEPDYGGLTIRFFTEDGVSRTIYDEPGDRERGPPEVSSATGVERVVGFDTDRLYQRSDGCQEVSDYKLNLQNCNSIHELNLLDSNVKYLAAGYWRQVFSLEHEFGNATEKVALKDLDFDHKTDLENFNQIRMDAVVAERLSANPRIYDIYGYCGRAIMSEFFSHGDADAFGFPEEPDDVISIKHMEKRALDPWNNLTGIQKLVVGSEMADGLAALHGHEGGLIIHNDVQPTQFLLNHDKSMLKLNDFNRAEFPLWNEENQEYCKYKNGVGQGNWRSPEEYMNKKLDEKIDVWSLGANMYYLLTGLEMFFYVKHSKDATQRLKDGEISWIDPRYKDRSKAEKYLAEIIGDCWKYDPSDRPSMFEIAKRLRDAVDDSLQQGETRINVLQSIVTKT